MSTVDWAQVSLTVALVVVTGLYVWQTRGIVKNMEKDREAMHRPILIFEMMYWWSSLILTLRIENVGGGAAVNVEGNIESRLKDGGSVLIPWSCELLGAGKYREFGTPMPKGTPKEDQLYAESVSKKVVDVRVKLRYKSTAGVEYELDEVKEIEKIVKVTEDGVMSGVLLEEHDEMSRVVGALERIGENLRR